MKFDELIVNHVGDFGTAQKIQFFLVCLPILFTAMHALSWTFTAADVLHRCRVPGEPEESANYWIPEEDPNSSFLRRLETCEKPNPEECPFQSCQIGNDTHKSGCPSGYVFDHSQISYSALQRWEIVCDRRILKPTIQSAYYIGQMIGSIVLGFLGDRIGRKKVFLIGIVLLIVCGFGMAIAPHWTIFGILRIGVGFAHPGIFVVAVVIGMELVGPKKRKIAGVITAVFFAFGQTLLGVLAYFIRDYRILQLAIAVPGVAFISYWWLIPESARWLLSQRRYLEADAILRKAAKANKKNLPERWWEGLDEAGVTNKSLNSDSKKNISIDNRKHNFCDLFATRKIRTISLSTFFCWPVVSMIYYGMSMKTDFLGGDLYTTFILGSLVEAPITFSVYFLLDRIGRKPVLAGGYVVAALCMASNLITDQNSTHWFISLMQFLIGKGAIAATYATIYTFTPELFPTVVRNMAIGVCSTMARIGAISASYIVMFLEDIYGRKVIVLPFAALAICAAIISTIFLPETMGRELKETIEEFNSSDDIPSSQQTIQLLPIINSEADEKKDAH